MKYKYINPKITILKVVPSVAVLDASTSPIPITPIDPGFEYNSLDMLLEEDEL